MTTVVAHEAHPLSRAIPLWHEPWSETWGRRAVTVPALFVLTLLDWALVPVILVVAALLDVVRGRDWIALRCHVALALNLLMHCVALVLMAGAWIAGGRWLGLDPERQRRFDTALELWWTKGAYRTAEVLFRMETTVEGAELAAGGPLIVFPRHASLVDVLLPFVLISSRHQLRLRYVVKRDLLYDPCIDVIGHRLPFAFVRRGTRQHAPEIAAVVHLMDGLDEDEGVLLYPEGTRFTPEKRRRRLEELAAKDEHAYARAARLKHLLAPRVGGPLGLLERNHEADVLFVAHTGLEGAGRLEDLFAGSLLDARVRVRFWRVPGGEIPTSREDRVEWLYDWWERIDAWIDANRAR